MTQTHTLTDDDVEKLRDECSADQLWLIDGHLTNAAYALGIQRARKVKPLVWHFDAGTEQWLADSCSYDDGHAVWKGRDDNWYTRMEHDDHMYATAPTPFHLTEDAAKDACFQCHAEYVLNLLEPI